MQESYTSSVQVLKTEHTQRVTQELAGWEWRAAEWARERRRMQEEVEEAERKGEWRGGVGGVHPHTMLPLHVAAVVCVGLGDLPVRHLGW